MCDKMSQPIKWGIVGTGNIAGKFAEALRVSQVAELLAVGSRTQLRADQFGQQFDIPHRYGSYCDLFRDSDVDAIYVSTPHPFHKQNAIDALNAGKAVLCEKPFTVNASQAKELIETARRKNLFLMEAMWTRFLPPIVKLRELLAQGLIGELRMLTADVGYRTGWEPDSRVLSPDLAGGALLGEGVYVISLASMVFGKPSRITGLAHIGSTGVDEQSTAVLAYDEGQMAVLCCAIRTALPNEAMIVGTEGSIRLHKEWGGGSKISLSREGKKDEIIDLPCAKNGFVYQIEEVAQCLRTGRTQSSIMPLDESLSIMDTMDELRRQWKLKYPFE